MIATTIPHSDFDDPECCGCLSVVGRTGMTADFVCSECGAIVACARLDDTEAAIHTLELNAGATTALCGHCGSMNIIVGLSRAYAFVCKRCGMSN